VTRAIQRRIETLEARGVGRKLDLAAQIITARKTFKPTHTRAELEALAADPDLLGRVARGWLRIGFVLPDDSKRRGQAPKIDPDAALAATMGHLYDKPLDFVLFAYEWGADRSLQVVKLPESYRLIYASEYGPDAWACDLLGQIGEQVRERAFDGRKAVDAIRFASASGHGIGKSAFTAWLVDWIMSTRPNARGVVTANTGPQLETKTWAEIAKWTKRCITGQWFDVTTGKGSMKLVHKARPESWRCDAQTCREENSEAFAGLHAADSTPFYLFDEASAIPAPIWQVAEGGMTDGEPMWFAFGNPTRNTGRFFECFNSQRHRWVTRQIDSREVAITNKGQIGQWVEDFGEDSDFVKVRVRGIFPSASSLQFIGRDVVDAAMAREIESTSTRGEPACVGVDVARFGDDQSVIRTRIGRDARSFTPIRLRGADTMTVAAHVAGHVNSLRALGQRVVLFIDGGGVGGGVIDRLRQLGFDPVEVQFGSRANDPRRYANKRAEIWGKMKEWLKLGAIEKDESLATDLCAVEYGFTPNGDAILLERKESMKARGLASPDDADALALTFAQPVAIDLLSDLPRVASHARLRREYDPLSIAARERHDPVYGFS